jgi:hypothetical protein
MDTTNKSEQEQVHADVAYEKRDVNTRVILYFVGVLFLVLVGTLLSMRGLFGYFSATQKLGPAVSPFDQSRTLPPGPRLQVEPVADLDQVRQDQNELLNSYGWADKANGRVRVPIDRAMDMLIERKLPVRQSATATQKTESEEKERAK